MAHRSLKSTICQFDVSLRYSEVSMWLMICQPLSAGAFDSPRTIQRTSPFSSMTLRVARQAPAPGMNSIVSVLSWYRTTSA